MATQLHTAWWKTVGGIIIIIAIILFLLILMIPTILGTSWGQAKIITIANSKIPGKLNARSIQINWWGTQTIEGLELQDPEGNTVLTLDHFSVESSLPSILWKGLNPPLNIDLKGLNAKIVRDAAGSSNLHQALGITPTEVNGQVSPVAIDLFNVEAQVNVTSEHEPLSVHVTGRAQSAGSTGNFDIDAVVEKGALPQSLKVMNARIKDLPVDILEQFVSIKDPRLGAILRAALGKTFDLTLDHHKNETGAYIHLQAQSPNLQADLDGYLSADKFILQKPGTLSFSVTPELIKTFNGTSDADIVMAQPARIDLIIDSLSIPLSADSPALDLSTAAVTAHINLDQALLAGFPVIDDLALRNFQFSIDKPGHNDMFNLILTGDAEQSGQTSKINFKMSLDSALQNLQAELTASPLKINGLPLQSDISLNDLKLKVSGNPLDEGKMQLSGNLVTHNSDSPLALALGNSAAIQMDGSIQFDEDWAMNLNDIRATLESDIASLQFSGEVIEGNQFLFNSPATFNYTLTPLAVQALGIEQPVETSSPVKLTIESIKKPIGLDDLNSLKIAGKIVVDKLQIGNKQSKARASFLQMSIPWEISGADNLITLTLNGKTAIADHPSQGVLKGKIEIRNWINNGKPDIKAASYSAVADLTGFPVAVLEAVTGQNGLTKLLGASLNLEMNANVDPQDKSRGGVNFYLNGDQFEGEASLALGDFITLKDPGSPALFRFVMTPARFDALRKLLNKDGEHHDNIVLLENTPLTAQITSLSMPWKPKNSSIKVWDIGLQADIKMDQFKAKDNTTGQYLGFEKMHAQLKSQDLSREIDFDLRGQQKDIHGIRSDMSFQGNLQHIFTANGKFNRAGLTLNLQARAQKLAAGLFCQIACLEHTMRMKLEALLGPMVDAEIEVHLQKMNGPVLVNLEGANGHIYLDAIVNEGVLTLKKPFQADVAATPQLGQSILQGMIPILSGMVEAENRLSIVIDPNGFSFPIHDESFAAIEIGLMTVNLGKVHFNNEGHLGKIMAILKANSQDIISVWFTPIYIEMHSGSVTLQRFDMLAMNHFPIAAWGTINLPNDRIDMTIGLSGKSLQSALNMPVLDKDYMMQFPLRGRIGHASIDKTKVGARMAALAAAMTATPQGLVLGAVIGLASGTLTEEKAPPPTTKPFPWESGDGSGDDQASADQQQEKRSKNPLKSLINSIFH